MPILMAQKTDGPDKLAKFMANRGISKRKAAAGLGVSTPTILDWLNGTMRPDPNNRKVIEVYTGGEVTELDWDTESDRFAKQKLQNMQPYKAEEATETKDTTPGAPSSAAE